MVKATMLALLMVAGPVVAAAQTAPPETAAVEQVKQEKQICRTEKVTGTRTHVNRICMTQREWDELATRTKQSLDQLARSAKYTDNQGPAPGP